MKFSHTLKTTAAPERIWAIWIDVENWSQWDTELVDADLEGAFVLGAIGRLKPKTGRVAKFEISQFNPGQSYTFALGLPLSSLQVHRYLSDRLDGTYFTHEVSFQGLLGWLFGLLLGRKFQSVLPSVMENVARIAES
jgi:Polyketide cyclase / dehydrase and lipid transport